MVLYLVATFIGFTLGFAAAALLAAGRKHDAARASDYLAEAVENFTTEHGASDGDPCTRILIPRMRLQTLQQALLLHDELRSA